MSEFGVGEAIGQVSGLVVILYPMSASLSGLVVVSAKTPELVVVCCTHLDDLCFHC